jgi:hypothetical protein
MLVKMVPASCPGRVKDHGKNKQDAADQGRQIVRDLFREFEGMHSKIYPVR